MYTPIESVDQLEWHRRYCVLAKDERILYFYNDTEVIGARIDRYMLLLDVCVCVCMCIERWCVSEHILSVAFEQPLNCIYISPRVVWCCGGLYTIIWQSDTRTHTHSIN